ncbi:MAG: HD-GYP domain-containing protein [Oscillospiraceae bacterium]|nr:HD-GYP domain-containing protein [Oscillospiraceae bacterium]
MRFFGRRAAFHTWENIGRGDFVKRLESLQAGRNRLVLTWAAAILCAGCACLLRRSSLTVVLIGGIPFAYTDMLIMLPTGILGLGCGLLTFSILFAAEFVRQGGNYLVLYALSTYLLLALIVSGFAYRGWFRRVGKAVLACLAISAVLALCWWTTFTVILPWEDRENIYFDLGFVRLFLAALPESAISVGCIALFSARTAKSAKAAGEREIESAADAWDSPTCRQVLGHRTSAIFLLEAFFLSLVAVVCDNLFAATDSGAVPDLPFLLGRWRSSLRMWLMVMCAAVPIAYLFNLFILNSVVRPINRMSFLMDRYFLAGERSRARMLPDLNIHSGDEIERLYQSLQKMVGDMGDYIDRELEQERKSAHLTHGFMMALAQAVDAKDRYTSGHSARVAKYSREIAKRLGKTAKEQEDIYTMGLLHDIGKIGVPESIINKNGRLTEEEFAKIKTHPVVGNEILKHVTEIPGLATGARWHHERYDGAGYPDGLRGGDIPEEARIIAVADTYDAMTSNRAYSGIREQQTVRAEIERCKGGQFDPAIADVMLSMIDDDPDYRMHE